MREDMSEYASMTTFSEENSLLKAPMSEVVFETDGYEVVCLVENSDTPDFEQQSKEYGDISPSSFKTSSGSFCSMKEYEKEYEELTDEPMQGYEVDSAPTHAASKSKGYFRSEQSDNSLVVYKDRVLHSPMSHTTKVQSFQ